MLPGLLIKLGKQPKCCSNLWLDASRQLATVVVLLSLLCLFKVLRQSSADLIYLLGCCEIWVIQMAANTLDSEVFLPSCLTFSASANSSAAVSS